MVLVVLLLFGGSIGHAGELTLKPAADTGKLQPGDQGYRHEEFHEQYQKVFNSEKCSCSSGECRVTDYRGSDTSPTGFEVKVSGKWCPVPTSAWIKGSDPSIPPELRVDPAHACGECGNLECVIINTDG
jgi:hypothetical protein